MDGTAMRFRNEPCASHFPSFSANSLFCPLLTNTSLRLPPPTNDIETKLQECFVARFCALCPRNLAGPTSTGAFVFAAKETRESRHRWRHQPDQETPDTGKTALQRRKRVANDLIME